MSSLSVQDLLELEHVPTEEQLTLQTIALFYKEHLCNQVVHYKVRHTVSTIKLHFRTFDLPHLLGIHRIVNGSANRGTKGFPALISGATTLDALKKVNSGGYYSTIDRILHFPFLYQLIRKPECIIFNPQALGRNSSIDAEFMIYNVFSGRYLNLGIKKEKSTDLYVPVTFVERKAVYGGMKRVIVDEISFIAKQEEKEQRSGIGSQRP